MSFLSDSNSLSSKGSDTATDCVTGGLSESLNKLELSSYNEIALVAEPGKYLSNVRFRHITIQKLSLHLAHTMQQDILTIMLGQGIA